MARRNRLIRIFESSIERLGRILSKKWKINVIFRADECKTDGNTVYLPALPDNADKDLLTACQGHLDHEASHCVHTDFDVIKKNAVWPKRRTTLNALEDPRIEKKWIAMYPGAKANLRKSADWALQRIAEVQEMPDPENPGQTKKMRPWDRLSDFGKVLHASITYTCSDFDPDHWFLKDVVEPEIMDVVQQNEDIFRASVDADSTGDVVPQVLELLKRLKEEDTKQEEPDPNQQPDPNQGQGVPGDPTQGQGQGGAPDDGTQKDQAGSPGQNVDQDTVGNGGDGMVPDNQKILEDEKLMSRHEQLKDAARRELPKTDNYAVYTTEGDQIERISAGDRKKYKNFMRDATRIVAPMKRKMARSLLSQSVSRWEADKRRGKINPRRLHQVVSGTSKRVFRQRVEAESFDTCVLMMVDHSGSMAGYQLDLAAKTAIVLGEILNQLGIPFSVLGFSTGSGSEASRRQRGASRDEQNVYTRWGNLWIGEYKSFDDSWQSSGPKMINMVSNSRQNTYDGESLRYGAQTLLQRPEKRKIMFWLNDGYPCPNGSDDSDAHRKYAHDCAREVEKMIELFAIGINTDAVKRFYSNCVQVNDLNDLPKTCLMELDALLRKGKTYIAA
jgi:cobalamin biosynthesis protein CobT